MKKIIAAPLHEIWEMISARNGRALKGWSCVMVWILTCMTRASCATNHPAGLFWNQVAGLREDPARPLHVPSQSSSEALSFGSTVHHSCVMTLAFRWRPCQAHFAVSLHYAVSRTCIYRGPTCAQSWIRSIVASWKPALEDPSSAVEEASRYCYFHYACLSYCLDSFLPTLAACNIPPSLAQVQPCVASFSAYWGRAVGHLPAGYVQLHAKDRPESRDSWPEPSWSCACLNNFLENDWKCARIARSTWREGRRVSRERIRWCLTVTVTVTQGFFPWSLPWIFLGLCAVTKPQCRRVYHIMMF